eukprot:CAMPEP_0174722356 /NCGR_PEP_ID=MMETSP1094-20130205/38263_1 /TAXON_ID=156173 /ORGANISM="Chrysochromulina brevifilum, Strain UTEX LB 985" /LENGTH=109 /DNA_ID=CAMNT_0015923199 /DNA_START=127 /DNA_END=456 /DNA_ORIENTATION=+
MHGMLAGARSLHHHRYASSPEVSPPETPVTLPSDLRSRRILATFNIFAPPSSLGPIEGSKMPKTKLSSASTSWTLVRNRERIVSSIVLGKLSTGSTGVVSVTSSPSAAD